MVLWTNPIYRKMYKGSLFKSTTNLKPIAGKIVGHGVKGGEGEEEEKGTSRRTQLIKMEQEEGERKWKRTEMKGNSDIPSGNLIKVVHPDRL